MFHRQLVGVRTALVFGRCYTAVSAAMAILACVAFAQVRAPAAQPSEELQPLRGKGKPAAKAARGKKPAAEDAALPAAAEDDWPMSGYDAGNTYYNSAEKTLKPPLVKLWEVKLPNVGVECVSVSSGIALATGLGGKVFGNKNRVMAIDARNGRTLWGFTLSGSEHGMYVTPACAGGLAFFGGQKDDNLYAVDLRTGAVRWQHGGMKSMHYCAVVAADGLLYANSDSGLWALDPQTGREKWHANNKQREGVRESAVKSGKVLQRRTGALDAATGAPLWSNDLIFNASRVAANDELVFVAAKDRIAALEMNDGKPRWEAVPKASANYARFLLVEDVLCAATRGDSATVYSLNIQTGKTQAERPIQGGLSKWVAANGVIYATTCDSHGRKAAIVAMAADTLQNMWSISKTYAVQSMAIANGRLYVVGIATGGGIMTAYGNK